MGAETVSGMETPWVHRYSVLVAACILIVVILGASGMSELQPRPGSTVLQRPDGPTAATGTLLLRVHAIAAASTGVLVLGLALWLSSVEKHGGLRFLGWIAVGAVVVEGLLGSPSPLSLLVRAMSFLHALLAPLVFSIVWAIAVSTSRAWRRGPDPVEQHGRPSLRSLAWTIPGLVWLQIALGAAYRHSSMGVISHVLFALLVMFSLLGVGVFLVWQYPTHAALRAAAVGLMVLTGIQVFLGFITYLMLLMSRVTVLAIMISSAVHIANGAMTMAAAVVLAFQIRRNVHGSAEDEAKSTAGRIG